MHISNRAIENPRLIILGAILLCVLGVAGAVTLPKERTPRVKLPVIVVAVPNPGASPEVNESQIVRKIEEAAGELTGLKDENAILSSAMQGAAVVQFIFDDGVDVIEAKRDVESMVNRIKGEFPQDAQRDPGPTVRDIAFEDYPVIQAFVAGGSDGAQRRRIAERLEVELEKIPGVSGAEIYGGVEREVEIAVDPNAMALYRFSYQDLEAALRRGNLDVPSGSVEAATGTESRVRSITKFQNIDQVRALPIATRQGKQIILADVADVRMGHKPIKSIARYGGEDAAVVLVNAKTDVDVLGAANRAQEVVTAFIESGAGEDTHIGTVRSQAREIHYMINQLGTSALYGTALVFIMLWIFLGWRNAALIGLSVPFAVLSSFAIMWFTKRSITPDLAINNMVLFALILVIGMVVDGCIIVGENIYRHRELGRSPLESAKRGIGEVGGSLISAYLTTIAAFGPMFMVRGIMGDFLGLLPTVVIFALCAAMLVDHFLLPVLSVYGMRVPKAQLDAVAEGRSEQVGDARQLSPEEAEIANAEALASASQTKRTYGNMLRYALNHRLLVIALSAVVAMTPVALFSIGAIGFEFFPDTDVPIIEVYYELPLGSSMQKRSVEVGRKIEAAVKRALREQEWYQPVRGGPRVEPVTTIGEPGALNIRLDTEAGVGPEFGLVYVELELAEHRERSSAQIRRAIVDELPDLPGVSVRVKSPSEGPPAGAPVLIRVLGQKETPFDVMTQQAAEIEQMLKSIPGTYDVTNDHRVRPQVTVTSNRQVASLYDLDTAMIGASINYALEGVLVGEVDFGGDDEIDLRLRNQSTDRDEVRDLANLPLRSPTGKLVTLEQVADVDRQDFANVLRHTDQRRVINIRSQLDEDMIPDQVKARVLEIMRPDMSAAERRRKMLDADDDVILANDQFIIEFGGENEIRDDAMEDLKIAMVVAAGLMLLILVVKFNSFRQSLIVLFSVPMSLVGVSIGLMIFGFYFSISSMIGVVALAGIVVNDAIVLVDFINQLVRAGVPYKDAVVYAGQMRLRPIFLTTITTVGGLLPLSLNLSGGGEFWQPLTTTIMFGLGFATLLQLFIIPIACYTFRPKQVSLLNPAMHPRLSSPTVSAGA